ncbi:MAG: NAD(P)/FAD-dependent oxidoreductase [Methanosarcinales archaeon]|nr:NAD(P)/FAD-dependent oxidoreductase [Methanosarcinales archaeon]
MKTLIIGGGLGGLLSGAQLAKAGHKVIIFERLPMVGGRFMNLDYKGYTLTSGALHMIPHGPSGPLGTMLKEVGANVDIIPSMPEAFLRIPVDGDGHRDIPFRDFPKLLSWKNRLKFYYISLLSRIKNQEPKPLKNWFYPFIDDLWMVKFSDSFFGWSVSLTSEQISTEEGIAIINNSYRYSGPGVPVGGCGAVIDALKKIILSGGGEIYTHSQVNKIILTNERAVGVEVEGKNISGDIVISNIGHQATAQLYNHPQTTEFEKYQKNINKIKPSAGIKICLGANKPLLGHGGILLTPYCKRINGVNEVTNIDPSLAPEGKHLIMCHQTLRSNDIQTEIKLGLDDINDIFQDQEYELLMVQTYHSDWPVNRVGTGPNPGNTTPIERLFIVGDGARGKGGIEVDGIAMGVNNTLSIIDQLTD